MSTVASYMTHARNFLKTSSTYASTEEVRLANTINSIIADFYRWHWNTAAGTDISISLGVQDYTMNAADQSKVLAIQNAYLTDATTTYGQLLVNSDLVVPRTATTGRPTAASLISPTEVRVWPNCNATYTLHWRYHKRAVVFAANTETWDVPVAFDAVAKAGMIWQLLSYQDDTRADSWQKTFYDLLQNLKGNERVTAGRSR